MVETDSETWVSGWWIWQMVESNFVLSYLCRLFFLTCEVLFICPGLSTHPIQPTNLCSTFHPLSFIYAHSEIPPAATIEDFDCFSDCHTTRFLLINNNNNNNITRRPFTFISFLLPLCDRSRSSITTLSLTLENNTSSPGSHTSLYDPDHHHCQHQQHQQQHKWRRLD